MSIVKVANHAGVSTATVSRVLNNFPGVRPETVRQVREALEALKYDPTRQKRGRRYGIGGTPRSRTRNNAIAIITLGQASNWLQLPVLASAVAGISRAAKDLGLRLVLEEILDLTGPLPGSMVRELDGAIVFLSSFVEPAASQQAFERIGQSLPAVWVMGGGPGSISVDHVAPDNHLVGHLAFEFLKSRRCNEVAFLSILPKWSVMRARGQAFCSAAHDSGARCSSFLVSADQRDGDIFGKGSVVEADLEALVDRLVKTNPRPTGLFISNDATTVQVYPLLQRKGLRPGEDIHVVSCDNEQIRLSGLNPQPASIDIGAEEAGWRAVHRLVNRLENPEEPPVLIQVAPRLVEPEAEAALAKDRVNAVLRAMRG